MAASLSDCGLLRPHPPYSAAGELGFLSDRGLHSSALDGKQFYQGTILCPSSCLHHCSAPTACLLPSSRSTVSPTEAAAMTLAYHFQASHLPTLRLLRTSTSNSGVTGWPPYSLGISDLLTTGNVSLGLLPLPEVPGAVSSSLAAEETDTQGRQSS